MHYIYKVVTLTEKNSNVVCLLNYLPTCDHFVKLSIKGLNNLRKKFFLECCIQRCVVFRKLWNQPLYIIFHEILRVLSRQKREQHRRSEFLLNRHSICNAIQSKTHSSTLLFMVQICRLNQFVCDDDAISGDMVFSFIASTKVMKKSHIFSYLFHLRAII